MFFVDMSKMKIFVVFGVHLVVIQVMYLIAALPNQYMRLLQFLSDHYQNN